MNILNIKMKYMKIMFLIVVITLISACGIVDNPKETETIPVVLNEISTKDNDWIELYNYSDEDVDLTDMILSDGKDNWLFPEGVIIKAKGFFAVTCDNELSPTDLNVANFNLSSKGETISLLSQGGIPIDTIACPILEIGQSYSRVPDGTGEWKVTDSPTKEASNNDESQL